MRSGLTFVALVAAIATSFAAPAAAAATEAPTGVVVNELLSGRYVELRNTSESTQDIGGYNLWLCNTIGVDRRLRISFGAQLEPGDFYVVATSSFTGGMADQTYPDRLPGSGAVLLDLEYGWVDGVAVVAGSPCGTGEPAPACVSATTARDAASANTRDNARDFACRIPSAGEPNQ